MVMSFRFGWNAAPYPILAPVRIRLRRGANGLAVIQPTLPSGGMAVKGHPLWGGPVSRGASDGIAHRRSRTAHAHHPSPQCSRHTLARRNPLARDAISPIGATGSPSTPSLPADGASATGVLAQLRAWPAVTLAVPSRAAVRVPNAL